MHAPTNPNKATIVIERNARSNLLVVSRIMPAISGVVDDPIKLKVLNIPKANPLNCGATELGMPLNVGAK